MKKALITLSIIGFVVSLLYYNESKSPIPTRSCFYESTTKCLSQAIYEFDYMHNLDPSQYYNYGKMLVKAGYYEHGIELLAKSENPIAHHEIFNAATQKIAEQAIINPNEVASFEPIDKLQDPSTVAGEAIQKRFPDTKVKLDQIYMFAYGSLAFKLVSASSGGGDYNYVMYNERTAVQKFEPSKTWDYLIKLRLNYALSLDEPFRSNSLLSIAEVLGYTKQIDRSYEIVKLVSANEQNSWRLVKLLEDIKKHEDARKVREEFRPKHENLLSYARQAKEDGDLQNTKVLLLELVEELTDENIKKSKNNKLGGKDKGRKIRQASLMLYEIGEPKLALDAANKSYIIEKKDPISRSFINYQRIASHYRSIAQTKEAKLKLDIAASKSPCYAFTNLGGIAKEYYLLGHLDLAAEKISQQCGSITVFGSMFGFRPAKIDKEKAKQTMWRDIYADAVISGKDTQEIIKFAGKEVLENAKPYLACIRV